MNIDKNKTKIWVGLSGGVDSSVSAALLKQQGYDVTGVFMKNWSGDNFGLQSDCPWESDQNDAEAVCKILNIPFRSINFEKEYRDKVVEYFFAEYKAGRTPNPDVMCNKEIKFGIFLQKAIAADINFVATGHYAQVQFNDINKEYELLKGLDTNKDQSYFLHQLTQKQLSKTLFPIGHLQKSKVRELAKNFNLPTATKPDSQGICFIGEIKVQDFLRARIDTHDGDIIDIDTNKKVGNHDGIEFYTIGQREGLKIGGTKEPYFVAKKDKEKNILFVAMGTTNPYLYDTKVTFTDLHLINNINLKNISLEASIRYRQKPASGSINLTNSTFTFDQPQRAIAPGQSLVLYSREKCLGGAVII